MKTIPGGKVEQIERLRRLREERRDLIRKSTPAATPPVLPTSPAAKPAKQERTAMKKPAKKTTKKAVKKVAKKKASPKAPKKAAKAKQSAPRSDAGPRPGSKLETVAALLMRPEGCTTAQVLEATKWPSISFNQQAKAAGLTLRKVREGRVTRYFGEPCPPSN